MTIDIVIALEATASAVRELNSTLSDDNQISEDPEAVLYGTGSNLDSLGLVNLVMAVEQHISEYTGLDVILASEAAMSRKRSPYRSLRALAEYAVDVSANDGEAKK